MTMLDIYIMENSAEDFKRLKEICFKFLIRKDYDAEIYSYSDSSIPETASIYILTLCNDIETISRKLRTLNSGSYVIVIVSGVSELKKAVTPGIAPSGLLIRPCEKSEVESVLDEIYADHMRTSGGSMGNFTFKLKAKEYSVPYEKIILFESRKHKMIVKTEIQEFEFYSTTDDLLENIPDCFVRIHKSVIVNTTRITAADYGTMTVEFDDGSQAYMSRTYKNNLREKLGKKIGSTDSQSLI